MCNCEILIEPAIPWWVKMVACFLAAVLICVWGRPLLVKKLCGPITTK
jgi:hypothetical protein